MKINQYGFPVVASELNKQEGRKAASRGTEASATIQISGEARLLGDAQAKLSGLSDVRNDKVTEASHALASGSLDTDAALEQALDRLIPDLF